MVQITPCYYYTRDIMRRLERVTVKDQIKGGERDDDWNVGFEREREREREREGRRQENSGLRAQSAARLQWRILPTTSKEAKHAPIINLQKRMSFRPNLHARRARRQVKASGACILL